MFVFVVVPITVFAWSPNQAATPFKVAHCATVSETGGQDPNDCTVFISKFKDGDVNCYVAVQNVSPHGDDHDPSISCTRDE